MLEILLRPAILGPAVLIFSYVLYKTLSPPDLPDVPMIGVKKGDLFPYIQASFRNVKDYKAAVLEAYEKYKDKTCAIPMLGMGFQVMLPVEETQWIVDQPDHVLDMHETTIDALQTDYTCSDPALIRNPTHQKLITTTLTSQVGNLVPEVADECEWSFDKHWKSDTENWTEIGVYETLRRIIGSVTNRVFIGEPYCREPELLKAAMAFAQDVPSSGLILRLMWRPLRPLVAPFLTIPNHMHSRQFLNIVKPEVQRRLREYDQRRGDPEKQSHLEPERNDFLEWSIKQAKESGDPREYDWKALAGRLLLLNFAAIHTTSFTVTDAIIDLAGGKKEYVEELREEIKTVLAEQGGEWSKQALSKMEKLDSVVRESTRLNSFVTHGIARLVVKPGGVTTPSGVHVPQGAIVVAHSYPIFRESKHYEDPLEFKPFRFAEKRHEEGVEYVKRARNAFATTSTEYLAFGHGRHACPGRFFAANEVKLLLGHIVLNYDLKPTWTERPKDTWYGAARVPDMAATVKIKRRKD